MEHTIAPDAKAGRLVLSDGIEQYTLRLGYIDPVDEVTGIQARLRNLGLYGGPIDGEMGPETEGAIKAFQQSHHLRETGEADQATKNALQTEHKS
jgi:peptidoglycan hydrolase-like protein with peptidoglycan-binding domain